MIYQQQSHLPIIFQVDEGILSKINDFIGRNNLMFHRVLVVSGTTFSRKIADRIAEENNWEQYVIKDNTFADVEELKDLAEKKNVDLMIGVGGGKVIDVVKRVSYLIHVNQFAVPTIISNDGLISPISVIKTDSGKTESIPGMMPMGVLIDLDIIKNSPVEFIRAAAGDILSNISATHDWILALQSGKERMNDIAYHLSRSAANSLIHFKNIDLENKQFLRMVIQGQIISGIAIALAGTSRPCSGSEHLISHAIDYLGFSNELHGLQVASISLFTLYLQNKLTDEHIKYAQNAGIPLSFTEFLDDFNKEKWLHILKKSRTMRPGRVTILDTFSNEELVGQLSAYRRMIKQYTCHYTPKNRLPKAFLGETRSMM